jgi:hypothetical protein
MLVKVTAAIVSPHGSQHVEFEVEVTHWLSDIPLPQDSYMNIVCSLFYEIVPNLKLVDKSDP